jgi:hypothetical protein
MEEILLEYVLKRKFDRNKVYSDKSILHLCKEFLDEYNAFLVTPRKLSKILKRRFFHSTKTPIGKFYVFHTNHFDLYERDLEKDFEILYNKERLLRKFQGKMKGVLKIGAMRRANLKKGIVLIPHRLAELHELRSGTDVIVVGRDLDPKIYEARVDRNIEIPCIRDLPRKFQNVSIMGANLKGVMRRVKKELKWLVRKKWFGLRRDFDIIDGSYVVPGIDVRDQNILYMPYRVISDKEIGGYELNKPYTLIARMADGRLENIKVVFVGGTWSKTARTLSDELITVEKILLESRRGMLRMTLEEMLER